jgi:hypothetical protein
MGNRMGAGEEEDLYSKWRVEVRGASVDEE